MSKHLWWKTQIKIKPSANVMKIIVSNLLVKHKQSNDSCDIVNKQQTTCIQCFLILLRSLIYENCQAEAYCLLVFWCGKMESSQIGQSCRNNARCNLRIVNTLRAFLRNSFDMRDSSWNSERLFDPVKFCMRSWARRNWNLLHCVCTFLESYDTETLQF